jgi:hypothetical protein
MNISLGLLLVDSYFLILIIVLMAAIYQVEARALQLVNNNHILKIMLLLPFISVTTFESSNFVYFSVGEWFWKSQL